MLFEGTEEGHCGLLWQLLRNPALRQGQGSPALRTLTVVLSSRDIVFAPSVGQGNYFIAVHGRTCVRCEVCKSRVWCEEPVPLECVLSQQQRVGTERATPAGPAILPPGSDVILATGSRGRCCCKPKEKTTSLEVAFCVALFLASR